MSDNSEKEEVKKVFSKVAEKIHEHHRNKKGRYSINTIMTKDMPLDKKELGEMGYSVKQMPDIDEEK